jgi:GNAT superfamily N-acetyltransferase
MSEIEETVIRPARAGDIPVLCRLLERLFSIERDFVVDPVRQQRGLELLLEQGEAAGLFVAERDGVVIGMCSAQVLISTAEGGAVAVVEDVVVDEAWRGHRIGTRLLEAVEQWARGRGLRRLQLLADRTNEPALAFYARLEWQGTRMTALQKRL